MAYQGNLNVEHAIFHGQVLCRITSHVQIKQRDLDYTTSILVDRFFSKNLRQTYFNNVCRKSAVVAFVIRQLSSAYSLEQVVDSNRMAFEESHLFPFVVYSWNSSIKDGS
ncbi:MAG TPA: hypothetical protein VK566_09910 [Nitrososphaeraceae archaeon]|nr:hypothetical protein [Nitrososphaeraceae archaeon]